MWMARYQNFERDGSDKLLSSSLIVVTFLEAILADEYFF